MAHSDEHRLRGIEAQARWELSTVAEGVDLYRTFGEARDVLEMTGGKRLLRLMMPATVSALETLKTETEVSLGATGGRRQAWEWHLMTLNTERLAFIALAGVLRGIMEGYATFRAASVRQVALNIAGVVQDQIEYERWAQEQKDSEGELLARLQKRYPDLSRQTWVKWRKKIELVREERLDRIAAVSFGSALLHCVVKPNEAYVQLAEFAVGAGKREVRLTATPETEELVGHITALAEVAHPPLRPMICPPNPWVYDEQGNASGGYIIHRAPLIRVGLSAHSGALKRSVSQVDLDALNAVQSVPWRINQRVYHVAQDALELGLELPGLPQVDHVKVPAQVGAEAWEAMTKEERQAHTKARREAYDAQASIRGVAISVRDRLDVATKMFDFPAIYFPHSRDFRGRMYPIPSRGPHPQADDLGKSLIEFAHGKPLGNSGLYWLLVRAANCAGQDKLAFDDRVAWAWEHYEDIYNAGSDPLGVGLAFWSAGEDPWQLLATCFELAGAMSMDDPLGADFVSHLPIALDGSCNGLQHLSAMGLDDVGAKATNLSSDPVRHDIYEDVARVVRQIVETDAAAGKPVAMAWHGRVTRKTCKRSVMTTPYGVTDRGIRRQLVSDDSVPTDSDVSKIELANYLGDCLNVALGQVIKASKGIMAWLQTVASRLAAANLPFDWQTPTGSTVRQAYYEQVERRVVTLAGKLVMFEEQTDAVLKKSKASLASAPNVVHSFDAAHLALTVNASVAEGITDLCFIHDSYGVHAGDTLRFAYILRQQFVDIYQHDWLQAVADYVKGYAPHVDLPAVPARDGFDITEVMNSPFFFS